jgi:hypothetical protein
LDAAHDVSIESLTALLSVRVSVNGKAYPLVSLIDAAGLPKLEVGDRWAIQNPNAPIVRLSVTKVGRGFYETELQPEILARAAAK